MKSIHTKLLGLLNRNQNQETEEVRLAEDIEENLRPEESQYQEIEVQE